MSTISGVNQTESKVILSASEQQQPASDVSVWNKEGAKECDANYYYAQEYQNPENKTKFGEWIVKTRAEDHGIDTEYIYRFLQETFGYSKEYVDNLDDDSVTRLDAFLENVFSRLYETDNKEEQLEQIIVDIKKMIANGNSMEEIGRYLEFFSNRDLLSILQRHLGQDKIHTNQYKENGEPVQIDNPLRADLRARLKNAKSINDLSQNDLNDLVMIFLMTYGKEDGAKTFLNIIDINLNSPEIQKQYSEQELGQLYSKLYNAFKAYSFEKIMLETISWPGGIPGDLAKLTSNTDKKVLSEIMNKCKGKVGALNTFLDNEKIGDILTKFNYKPEELRDLLTELQLSLPDENGEPNQALVQKLVDYVAPLQAEVLRIRKIPEESRTPEEKQTMELFNDIKQSLEMFNIHILTFGEEETVAQVSEQVNQLGQDGLLNIDNIYQGVYENSLKIDSLDPFKIMEMMDKYSNNAYSDRLRNLGFELPTAENIDSLREKAANGTLIPSEEDCEALGYTQSAAQSDVDYAAGRAEYLLSYINNNQQQETFTIDGKVEDNATEKSDDKAVKSVNTANLGRFSGGALKKLVNDGVIPFINAVKEYSRTLSESGKDYVENTIKQKNDGEKSYILNQVGFTTCYEIMDKTKLLDNKQLRRTVKLDSIHEQLRDMA